MLVALALFLCAGVKALPLGAPASPAQATHTAAPHDPPRILDVAFTPTEFGSGDVVRGKVLTSSNVASVEARIGAFGANLERLRPGEFALEYTVPWLPFFFHHAYDVAVTARNVDGVATTRLVPIKIH